MKNTITDLRNHLFETIESLKDEDSPMDIQRAKAISDVAQVVINSAKVELQFMELVGEEKNNGFFSLRSPAVPALAAGSAAR